MNNILSTGGAGYIGSYVCYALACAGFTAVVYDHLSFGYRGPCGRVRLRKVKTPIGRNSMP